MVDRTPSRYIPHPHLSPDQLDIHDAREVILNALQTAVRRVHTYSSPKESVYIGLTGTFVMDMRIASLPETKPLSTFKPTLPKALNYPITGGHTAFLETSVGTATLHLISQMNRTTLGTNDPASTISRRIWHNCVELIKHAVNLAVEEAPKEDGCEVLYGRAGLLYALLLLRNYTTGSDKITEAVKDVASDANVRALINDIITRGHAGAQAYAISLSDQEKSQAPPLMWSWHGKRYLGGAHGVAGILQMLISAPKDFLAPHWSLIVDTIKWLVAVQMPSGNWPTKAGRHTFNQRSEQDQLVQWCHGAPGVLILFSTFLRRFSQTPHPGFEVPPSLVRSLRSSLIPGGDLVYARGFLRKGVGLCHGVAGSVYALLAVSDILDPAPGISGPWFTRAVYLAQLAGAHRDYEVNGEMDVPDRPYSLYEGVAGMCCAWTEVLARLNGGRESGMPGYDDLQIED